MHPNQTNSPPTRQQFHNPKSSLGGVGHWVKTAGILAPLLIGELVKDEGKRWRYIRISSVVTALVSEALWTQRVKQSREPQLTTSRSDYER